MSSGKLPLLALLLVPAVILAMATPRARAAGLNIPQAEHLSMAQAPQPHEPQTQQVTIGVYDPTGKSPTSIQWAPYPAPPPTGFHWQHSGRGAMALDPSTREPLPGETSGHWV